MSLIVLSISRYGRLPRESVKEPAAPPSVLQSSWLQMIAAALKWRVWVVLFQDIYLIFFIDNYTDGPGDVRALIGYREALICGDMVE
jgi:hypothetical protein